jgi:hypothetical protein
LLLRVISYLGLYSIPPPNRFGAAKRLITREGRNSREGTTLGHGLRAGAVRVEETKVIWLHDLSQSLLDTLLNLVRGYAVDGPLNDAVVTADRELSANVAARRPEDQHKYARSINLVKLPALRIPAGLALKRLLVPDERIEARHPRAAATPVGARNPRAAERVLENITPNIARLHIIARLLKPPSRTAAATRILERLGAFDGSVVAIGSFGVSVLPTFPLRG